MFGEKIKEKENKQKKSRRKSILTYVMSEYDEKNNTLTFWSGLFSHTFYQAEDKWKFLLKKIK